MRILRFFLFVLALMASAGNLLSQETSWSQYKVLEGPVTKVKTDQLNSIYAVRNGEIIKYDAQGKMLTRYSNKLIGDGVKLDVTNPMKVILYSEDQMRLIFLDSRLGELREEINLFNQGYEQISLAATSHSNGFWLYDPINFKLIRFDQYFKKERESLNIAQLLRVEFYPTDMIEIENKVYLTDPKNGIYVFDVYGNYIKRIPLKGVNELHITDQRIFFERGGKLFGLNLIDQSEEIVQLESAVTADFDLNRTMLCLVSPKGIIIYTPKE